MISETIWKVALPVCLLLTWVAVAYADNCSDLTDCFSTIEAAVATTVGVAVAVGVAIAWRFQDSPKEEVTVRVFIEAPMDLTIQLCGEPITFTARTEPPGRESKIHWGVPGQQHQTASSGTGPTFATSWTETGVKQVVATIDESGDDLILFLFKTKARTGTLRDILDCEPPPIERSPRDYKWYRNHDIPSDDVEA